MELRKSEGMRSNVTPPAVESELLIIYPSYEYGVGAEFQNHVRFLSPELPSVPHSRRFPGLLFRLWLSWPPEIWRGGQICSDSCCPRCSTFGRQTAKTWKMYLGGVKSRSIPAPLELGVASSLYDNFDSNPQEYLEKFYRKIYRCN